MRTAIAAEPQRVWRALTEPEELVGWDPSRLAAIDPPDDYPSEGESMRWRYRLGSVQLVLHELLEEIVPLHRLQSRLSLSSLRFEQTYSLAAETSDRDGPITQVGLRLSAKNSVPVLGTVVDRFEVRRLAVERVGEAIRSLQQWCEKSSPKAPGS